MNKVIVSLILVAALAGVGVLADSLIKLAENSRDWKFVGGLLIYALSAFGWFYAIRYFKLATIGVFDGIISLLLMVIVGTFYFKEQLHTGEIMGIILAIISLVLLGRFA